MKDNTLDNKPIFPFPIIVGRLIGAIPFISDINNTSSFIECDVSPDICPMKWENLEKIESQDKKRYCEYCDKNIFLVNEKNQIKEFKEENKCMAVPISIVEQMNKDRDIEDYQKLENNLKLSMLFLVAKKQEVSLFEEIKGLNLSREQILKKIIINICNSDNFIQRVKLYQSKNVDLEFITTQILLKIEDDIFKQKINKIINYFTKKL